MDELTELLKTIDISTLSNNLSSLFDEALLSQQAKETGFIVRNRSGLSGRMFLIMNVLEFVNYPNNSLQEQCEWLEENYGVRLTKQSLDERYNTFAVGFMRSCFKELLSGWVIEHKIMDVSGGFSRILLQDSTTCQLPATMAAFYPSKDASKTGASLKLDYCFNYLDGKVEQLILESGRVPDSKINMEYQPNLKANDLIIKDLGYWNCKQLEQYNSNGIYFLSRLKTDASLYDLSSKNKINIEDFLPDNQQIKCFHCLLGTQKTPVRVSIEKVPEYVRLERLEKLKKQAKSQNWTLSVLRIKLCGYNVYVTNASEGLLPRSLIRLLYSIRWQIELIFKAWKSVLNLDEVKSMSVFRVECMLYGRLILILLNNNLQSFFKQQIADIEEYKDFELSEMKATKTLKKR